MLKLQITAQLGALKTSFGFSLLGDPLYLDSSEINSGGAQLPPLVHLSLTKQGVSGPGAL